MDEARSALRAETLLEHTDWVRRLAAGLVHDPHAAEDVAQETWLRAVRRPPHPDPGLRSWFVQVARRLAIGGTRADSRRARRERAVARPEAQPGPDRAVERLEVHRHVVEAVLALPPASREAVALRYFEGLSPREIARRTGLPVETVKTRLRRGLAALRARLDRELGGSAACVAALGHLLGHAPAAPHPLVPWITGGTIAVSKPVGSALCAAALLLALGVALAPRLLFPAAPSIVPAGAPLPASGEPPVVAVVGPSSGENARIETPAAVFGPSVSPRSITGRLWVGEDGASEVLPSEATIVLGVLEPGFGIDRERGLAVRDGAFTIESDGIPFERLAIDSIDVGGRPAYVESPGLPTPVGGIVEIHARFVPSVVLRVRDASTGIDLDGLEVLRDVPRPRHRIHPGPHGPEAVVVRDGRSPLVLPPVAGVHGYWVRGASSAWGHVEIDHRAGGERELRLVSGGSLLVRVTGLDPDVELRVRLYAETPGEGERAVAEQRPGGGPARFAGLIPGTYRLRAEVGDWWDPPEVLAEGTVDVAAGASATIELAVPLARLPEPATRLAGTLRLPEGFEDLEISLRLAPRNRAPWRRADRGFARTEAVAGGASGLRAWDLGAVTPGPSVIVVDPLQLAFDVDVPRASRHEVSIELPPLGILRVRVTSARTGEPIPDALVEWSPARDPGLSPWQLQRAERDARSATSTVLSPVGPLDLHVRAPGHATADRREAVSAALREIDLALEPLPSFRVTLRDGAATVPFAWGRTRVRVVPAGDTREAEVQIETEGGRFTVFVPRPGLHRLEIEPLEGFEPIAPRDVLVEAGARAEVEIPLLRSR